LAWRYNTVRYEYYIAGCGEFGRDEKGTVVGGSGTESNPYAVQNAYIDNSRHVSEVLERVSEESAEASVSEARYRERTLNRNGCTTKENWICIVRAYIR